jgi:hypothetical protein
MTEKFQTLENIGRKSSKPWKFFAVLFPMLGSLAMAQGPGGQRAFFQALFWGQLDPYERLLPTAYWYPSKDLNNTDRILGIASTNTVNAASVGTNGWDFSGSTYLDVGRPSQIELGTNLQYSMSVWVRARATGFFLGIMGKTFAGTGDRFGLGLDSSTHWAILNESTVNANISSGGAVTGVWYHLTFTIDRSITSNVFLYRDGVRVATGSFTNTAAITYDGNVNAPFRFGSFNNSAGAPAQFWNGFIDQAAVWKGRALTSNEVFNLFQDTRSGRK